MKTKNEKKKPINKEFLQYISNNPTDCSEDVFKRAKTPWQKQVAVELFINEKDHEVMQKDMSHVKKMVWAIFAVVAITAIANFASNYIFPLLGVV